MGDGEGVLYVGERGCVFRIEGGVVGMAVLAARGVCTCVGWVGGDENGLVGVNRARRVCELSDRWVFLEVVS